ncbi:hypothetical protein ACIQY5_24575 [Peribacillus frigoritolerans]|uniref:hypothetical protein n=1 Tax=Peribacillus frigoritolerans TaxID=450367 RepID=UPI0038134AB8
MDKDFFWSIFTTIFGIIATWTGLIYTTRFRFDNRKFFEHIKYITPLPQTVNYWFLKVLFIFGGLMCVVLGLYGILYGIPYRTKGAAFL